MSGRFKFWTVAAFVFSVINVAGGVYAAVMGEMMHAGAHLILLAGTVAVWQIAAMRRRPPIETVAIPQLDSHLENLQHSVDAIAVEVERIGEAQRFINKLQQDQVEVKR